MYGYKRNRIQVCPGCRKSFSLVGENHTLHIMQPVLYEEYHFGGSSIFNEEVLSQYEHPYKTKEEYLNDITYLKRFVNEYDYVLQVPSVPGKVRGGYINIILVTVVKCFVRLNGYCTLENLMYFITI